MDFLFFISVIAVISIIAFIFFRIRSLSKRLNLIKETGIHFKQCTITDRLVMLKQLDELRKNFSDWTILVIADRYKWSPFLVTCIPKLFFKISGLDNEIVIWKEVLKFIPTEIIYKIKSNICGGEVVKISTSNDGAKKFEEIATILEFDRLNTPYPSYNSLFGVINQTMLYKEHELSLYGNLKKVHLLQKGREEILKPLGIFNGISNY
ncbi:MAG TPA: hypothetical protein PL089_13860 [Ignavibacteria bacterium]|nr:hypothetical protein [Ignavibacteriaceae bacterium]HRK00691.1 hypothetical protein [Ignavibacteria bacterium]